MPLPFNFPFNWREPDYKSIYQWRGERLEAIRADQKLYQACCLYYRDHPAAFITDWGFTFDPRNPEVGLPSYMPFILFPRQEEMITWLMQRWKTQTPGACVKSREMGMSWLTIAFAVTLCLFNKGITIGFGSRIEKDVDNKNDPGSLFEKARQFIDGLPIEFLAGCDLSKTATYMKILFPDNNSMLYGAAGKNMARGSRGSLFFLDEAAHVDNPKSVDQALSRVSNCRIHISTPNGPRNPFKDKVDKGLKDGTVFTYFWRDDPRKDDAWYQKQVEELDPVTLAQEVNGDFNASVEGVLIPSAWVQSAIDAHIILGIEPTGVRKAGLDIADLGVDKNSFCGRHGILVEYNEIWSGSVGGDILRSIEKAALLCDREDYEYVVYDGDGMGAAGRGDARSVNEDRKEEKLPHIPFYAFHGSGAVLYPDQQAVKGTSNNKISPDGKGRSNKNYFANAKSQAWWMLRNRFMLTNRVIEAFNAGKEIEYHPDDLISLSSEMNGLNELVAELSQPICLPSKAGKLLIDKAPDSTSSPNRADSLMICFAPEKKSTGVHIRVM